MTQALIHHLDTAHYTRKIGMKQIISKHPFARQGPKPPADSGQIMPSWSAKGRCVSRSLGIFCALMLAHSPAFAADRATCTMAVKLLETIDRGLEAAAAGEARGATSGIAVFAQQTQHMADQYSQNDPLPDDVVAALAAILAEIAAQYFIADAAPVLLEQSLIIQQAMPDICAGSEIPDLNRHLS